MTRPRPLDLERIRHVPGETLLSRDLRDQLSADLELLWWHQRAVHEPGVVAGLTIEWDPGDEATGVPPSVAVEPGLAYDARGRELTLLTRQVVEVPEVDRASALLVRRREGARAAELVWRPLGAIEPCDGIPLALLRDGVVRPSTTRTRSLERPRVGAGETQPDATAWEFWREDSAVLGIEVRVDTSAAGFTDVPCYFAWLNWPRPGDAVASRRGVNFTTLGLQYVQDETARGFTFRVRLGPFRAPEESLAFARRERLSVCWLGVQCDHDARARGKKRRRDVPVG